MAVAKKTAFMVAYGGGHCAMLIPVARALMDRGWRVDFLALTTGRGPVEQAAIPALGFSDLYRFAPANSRTLGEELTADMQLGGVVSAEETIAYHGINLAELIQRDGEERARADFAKRGRHAFLPRDFMRRVLTDYAPDIVIATNSPRAERAAIEAAGDLAIPSVCALDMFGLQEIEWIGREGFADRITVLNGAVRNMVISHGRKPAEVVVTGNPQFDALSDPECLQIGQTLRRERGWDDSGVTMLWASQIEPLAHPFADIVGDPLLPRKIEAALRQLVAEDDRLRLVVRYHPSENVPFIAEDRVFFSPPSEPLHPLLHAMDLVIVTASTVGLEAYLARKPVISVDRSIFTADAPFAKLGISDGVDSIEDLVHWVRDLNGERPSFPLPGQFPSPDEESGATAKVVALIEDVVS